MRYLLISIAFLMVTLACKKSSVVPEPRLVLSKTTVARGEIVTATVADLPEGIVPAWDFPSGCFPNFQPDASKVSLFYRTPGEYELKVRLGEDPGTSTLLSAPIKVTDDYFFTSSLTGNLLPLANEEVSLTPCFEGDSTLSFIFNTTGKKYVLNSYIVTRDESLSNRIIKFSMEGLWMERNNEPTKVRSNSVLFTREYYTDGFYPVEINFNNKRYTGTLQVAENQSKYFFEWPYDTELVFTTTVLKR